MKKFLIGAALLSISHAQMSLAGEACIDGIGLVTPDVDVRIESSGRITTIFSPAGICQIAAGEMSGECADIITFSCSKDRKTTGCHSPIITNTRGSVTITSNGSCD